MKTLYRIILTGLGALMLAGPAVYSASARPSAEAFGTLPDIYDAAISPDATQIAVIINVGGTYGMRVINLQTPGDKPRIVWLGKTVKPGWVKWANNTQVLMSVWQSDKIGRTPVTAGAIYTLNTVSMEGKYLIKRNRNIVRQYTNRVIDFLDDDPDHILMSFSDTDQSMPDIQKVNVETGKYKKLKRGRSYIQHWYTDLTGEPRAGQGLKESSTKEEEWYLTIRDTAGDTWRQANYYPGLEAKTDIIGFTGDPDEMIVRARRGRDTSGLYIYNLGEKKYTRTLYHDDKYDAGGVILSGDGKRVIGTKFVAEESETKLFDDEDTVLEDLRKQYDGYTVDYIDQSKEGEIILFRVSNAYEPGQLMMIDTRTDTQAPLGEYRKGLPADQMGEVISVSYKARDGFVIPAYVTVPPGLPPGSQLKDIPFIVLPHGGPYARSSKRFDYFAQFFASRGYGVLQMNFRGSSGYGKKYKDAGRQNWVVMQEDVEDGARWLLEKGYADPDRMCIAGWSFGGYAALMGSIKNPDIYKCGISMAGVTDIADLVRDAKKYRFGALTANKYILGGFEDRDAIKENSPVKRADELKIPLFLAHGRADQRVHFDQYTRMKSALRKSDAKVTYMEFKDEDHFLSNQENRIKFFEGLDGFLESVFPE